MEVPPVTTEDPPATAPASSYEPAAARQRFGLVDRRLRGRLAFESLLIVLSVLVGLALNDWREHRRERELATMAMANFRREIAENLDTLERVHPKHVAMQQRLADIVADPPSRGTAFDVFLAELPRGGLDTPPLRDAAWETASSTGALRLLDYETAALLSETYLVQRSTIQQTISLLADRFLSPANFDPASREAMIRTHRMLLVELTGQETYLIATYRRALQRLPAR